MNKLEAIEEIVYLLNNDQILFLIEKGKPTFFAKIASDRIRVNNENTNYIISVNQFKQLFTYETFYLYEKKDKEETVSDTKDEEYYSWRHK